ncbi:Gfo/Idh/MocA family protein [Glycomyces algeriensis]|uniref:Oxidoreductase n=1 Tax=Glycomyces algeriensis TaxID=256037 RepID=A0A9W6GBY9_9ACTN|nr:Gfo/Idh/MocA family oxidoreductase [Glycomyces algeriensis]MDA1365677.1 Gfo/Idh/MocA family oxidoreductase [Glycomyces algeriensis]MDR7351365.1 putative dehydrogenase [Glycomyces algeriensis]GLI44080.1 oxidoreductase [Glycomyces algeriensis]
MLRIGIIGTGGIAGAHIGGYLAFPEECEIVALADVMPGKAAEKAAAFGLANAVGYDDPVRMIAEARLDLVSIATPPSTHAALAVAALDAGVNVLVEKPMAPSLEECDAMLAAQERSGRLLSVVAQNRFRDDLAALKTVLDSGLLGSVSHVRVDSAWWRGMPYYDLWWRGTWEKEGGGCTLNHAIHHIDLLLWLLGSPTEITAMLANAQHDNSEVEDLSVAVLRYERGLAQLTSSVVHHGEEQEIVIQGERARVSQPWKVIAERSGEGGFPERGGDPELVAAIEAVVAQREPLAHHGHEGQIGDLLGAIRDRRAPIADGRDGRAAIEVVTAIYKAGIERAFVALPLQADDPYYRAGRLVEHAPHFYEKQRSLAEAATS